MLNKIPQRDFMDEIHVLGADPYAEFSRRNGVESVVPVVEALRKGKKKYEDEN